MARNNFHGRTTTVIGFSSHKSRRGCLAPPLTITLADLDSALERLEEALAEFE